MGTNMSDKELAVIAGLAEEAVELREDKMSLLHENSTMRKEICDSSSKILTLQDKVSRHVVTIEGLERDLEIQKEKHKTVNGKFRIVLEEVNRLGRLDFKKMTPRDCKGFLIGLVDNFRNIIKENDIHFNPEGEVE